MFQTNSSAGAAVSSLFSTVTATAVGAADDPFAEVNAYTLSPFAIVITTSSVAVMSAKSVAIQDAGAGASLFVQFSSANVKLMTASWLAGKVSALDNVTSFENV